MCELPNLTIWQHMSGEEGKENPSYKKMWDVQRGLSKWQAVPLVGPLLFSPLKAVVSLVQIVVSFVFALLSGFIGLITIPLAGCCGVGEFCVDVWSVSIVHLLQGLLGFGYSVANITTLGCLGCAIEGGCAPMSDKA